MSDHQLSKWEQAGYARAMALCTKAKPSNNYPTLDKHSLDDEAAFIRGFNLGLADFKSRGYQSVQSYGEEKHGSDSQLDTHAVVSPKAQDR